MLGPNTEFEVSDAEPHVTENGSRAVVMLENGQGSDCS